MGNQPKCQKPSIVWGKRGDKKGEGKKGGTNNGAHGKKKPSTGTRGCEEAGKRRIGGANGTFNRGGLSRDGDYPPPKRLKKTEGVVGLPDKQTCLTGGGRKDRCIRPGNDPKYPRVGSINQYKGSRDERNKVKEIKLMAC